MTSPAQRYSQASDAIRKRTGFLNGFKEFISRGNAIELAVGIVIGAAFTAVVTAIVDGVINPLVGGIFGQPNLDEIGAFTIGNAVWTDANGVEQVGATLRPGTILTALFNFLIVAAAIYFIVVLPLNKLAARRNKAEELTPEAPSDDVILLGEIRDLLKAQAEGPGQVPGQQPRP
ncbi:large conductance mechanosensitive channel protein MscL [Litorihabitans aurantiacus]|uniref:Large-conductance mechanosensitive channel n=1 Tax=Litorihabitans aurantiacus TaxID=1930061 RepID=A0AA37XAT2_9MICO|nr:large conductance mechanosensitive channel protein MscL [Litorihabitans aurantiacus]GMA30449.1 large-conductance mechanosensitive channel [Litorihabitans aurantiacus]